MKEIPNKSSKNKVVSNQNNFDQELKTSLVHANKRQGLGFDDTM